MECISAIIILAPHLYIASVLVMILIAILCTKEVHMGKVHSDCVETGSNLTEILHTLKNATSEEKKHED